MIGTLSKISTFEGNKLHTTILFNGDFLAFFLYVRKYAYIGTNSL